jgi:hypothetical protein
MGVPGSFLTRRVEQGCCHGAGLFSAAAEHANELLDAGFADNREEA